MASDTSSARLYVAEVTKWPSRAGFSDPQPRGKVILRPALNNPANAIWASATPSAEFSMTINGNALPWFEARLGKDLHITFADVPEEQEN